MLMVNKTEETLQYEKILIYYSIARHIKWLWDEIILSPIEIN